MTHSLDRRLRKIEDRAGPPGASPPATEPPSQRWLSALELLLPWLRDMNPTGAEEIAEAVQLLQHYREAGTLGVFVEDHCRGSLVVLGGWINAQEGNPWFGQPFPFLDELKHLRERLQLDARCAGTVNVGRADPEPSGDLSQAS